MQDITANQSIRVAESALNNSEPFQQLGSSEKWDAAHPAVTYKEYIAIKSLEMIPVILQESKHPEQGPTVSPTAYFSPAQFPLQNRMAAIFSSSMERARLEVEQGTNSTNHAAVAEEVAGAEAPQQEELRLQAGDIMSKEELDVFLSNIETFRLEHKGETVWYRRYHRVVRCGEARPGARKGKTLPEFVLPTIGQKVVHAGEERVEIAVVELNDDGISVGGWWRLPDGG